ncbi:P-loop containing nucleoside triphosphate hydrolase protein [Apiospora aurea]|uniref:P-loop containing nucleoside triphosphate hydrolase protein n=1 Tax=Apiospora aurea TaxID=335848 RepID=A0ABR1PTF9_9PEZI
MSTPVTTLSFAAYPPAIINGIRTKFGPFVAGFAESWLRTALGRHQHNPLAAMLLTSCLYILHNSGLSLLYKIPGTLARLVRLFVSSLARFCTPSIAVRQADVVASDIIKWTMTHIVLPRNPMALMAGSERPYYTLGSGKHPNRSLMSNSNDTKYYPDMQPVWFFRGWRPFAIHMSKPASGPGKEGAGGDVRLQITTVGFSCKPIKDFVEQCRAWVAASERNNGQIRIFMTSKYDRFGSAITMPIRPLETVYLDERMKQGLVHDMAKYLNPESEQYYINRGIPYRRGYLLHGPPGTGKTSLVNALAGHFNLPVYIVDLGSRSDDVGLQNIFKSIAPRSIVLLEDIDANKFALSRREEWQSGPRITLTGLLNVLDGVASPWGRIVIMTTNHAENLDAALKRPGRADMHLYIGHITQQCAKTMFLHQLGNPDGAIDQIGESVSNDTLGEMAEQFSQQIPEGCITPAKLGNFLLQHRNDPAGACSNIASWVTEQIQADNVEGAEVLE